VASSILRREERKRGDRKKKTPPEGGENGNSKKRGRNSRTPGKDGFFIYLKRLGGKRRGEKKTD